MRLISNGSGFEPGQLFGGDDALGGSHMRQQQFAGHIPDGPHAGHIGGAEIIHLDEAALGEGDPGFLQAQILGVGAEAGCQQHLLHLEGLLRPRGYPPPR